MENKKEYILKLNKAQIRTLFIIRDHTQMISYKDARDFKMKIVQLMRDIENE